jgi:hypothetical protein
MRQRPRPDEKLRARPRAVARLPGALAAKRALLNPAPKAPLSELLTTAVKSCRPTERERRVILHSSGDFSNPRPAHGQLPTARSLGWEKADRRNSDTSSSNEMQAAGDGVDRPGDVFQRRVNRRGAVRQARPLRVVHCTSRVNNRLRRSRHGGAAAASSRVRHRVPLPVAFFRSKAVPRPGVR